MPVGITFWPLVHLTITPSIKFPGINTFKHAWAKKGTMRVKCFAKGLDPTSFHLRLQSGDGPGNEVGARPWTAQSGVQLTRQKTIASLVFIVYSVYIFYFVKEPIYQNFKKKNRIRSKTSGSKKTLR